MNNCANGSSSIKKLSFYHAQGERKKKKKKKQRNIDLAVMVTFYLVRRI